MDANAAGRPAGIVTLAELIEKAVPSGCTSDPERSPGARLNARWTQLEPRARRRILSELDSVLARGLCDMQMAHLLAFELGSHLDPAEMGLTPTEWLGWVRRQLLAGQRHASG